jgi:cell wall assembly regulator SMI1
LATAREAVEAVRHVVQEHGDDHSRLGGPADPDAVRWFARLLGWEWPPSYVDVLASHDGVLVEDAIVYRFVESIETLLLRHQSWHRPDGFWPVASDGCGNYYALALAQRQGGGECPVVFFDMIADRDRPADAVAPSYADFVCGLMRRQCERRECPGESP